MITIQNTLAVIEKNRVNLRSTPAESELAYYLRTVHKMTTREIAETLQLTDRQVLSRLSPHRLKYTANGQIPTKEFQEFYAQLEDGPTLNVAQETYLDEAERKDRLASGREGRHGIAEQVFSDRLASVILPHVPSDHDLSFIEKLHSKRRPLYDILDDKPVMAAIAVQSDMHLCLVNKEINFDKTLKANDHYFDQVFEQTERKRRDYHVGTLHYVSLGDNFQGTGNYPAQRWDTDRCALDQAEAFVEVAIRNIERGLVEYDEVIVSGQRGNHGKTGFKSVDPDHQNWEAVALKMIEYAFRGSPRVRFNLTKDWYQIVPVLGSQILLTHGDAIPGPGSVEGLTTTLRKWSDILPYYDYAFFGHFHRSISAPLPPNIVTGRHRKFFVNGGYPLAEDFLDKMGAFHSHLQWLHFITGNGIEESREIELYR